MDKKIHEPLSFDPRPPLDRALARVGDDARLIRRATRDVFTHANARQALLSELPVFDPPRPMPLPPPHDLSALTAEFPIVHADDDDSMRRLTQLILARWGLTVLSIANPLEVLDVCRYTPVSLVLTDVMKADITGYEMVGRLRADPLTETIPVIFMSARAMVFDRLVGLQLGAVDYLPKPVLADELLASVSDALTHYGNWRKPPVVDTALAQRVGRRTSHPRHEM